MRQRALPFQERSPYARQLAQLQSKIIVDGAQEAIRGLNQVASALQATGTGADSRGNSDLRATYDVEWQLRREFANNRGCLCRPDQPFALHDQQPFVLHDPQPGAKARTRAGLPARRKVASLRLVV